MSNLFAGLIKDGNDFVSVSVNAVSGVVSAEYATGTMEAVGLYVDSPYLNELTEEEVLEKFEERNHAEAIGIMIVKNGFIEFTEDTAYIYNWGNDLIDEKTTSFDGEPGEGGNDGDDIDEDDID